jgi:F0F1-type ATP synthase epsilon subunit
MPKPVNLALKIYGRNGVLFQGQVSSVSSANENGVFDILPGHANFISLIKSKIIYRDAITKQEHEVRIGSQAVLKATGDGIVVFLGM